MSLKKNKSKDKAEETVEETVEVVDEKVEEPTEEPAAKKEVKKPTTKTAAKPADKPKFPQKAVKVMNKGRYSLSCTITGKLYKSNQVMEIKKEDCNDWVRRHIDNGMLEVR